MPLGDGTWARFVRDLADGDPYLFWIATKSSPCAFPILVTAGGSMFYGANNIDQWRQGASNVDRIFWGVQPRDLPIQLPTKFELVLNLKTAKALGIEVPPMLLARADEVIELVPDGSVIALLGNAANPAGVEEVDARMSSPDL